MKEHSLQLKSDCISVRRALILAKALPKFFSERVALRQAEDAIKIGWVETGAKLAALGAAGVQWFYPSNSRLFSKGESKEKLHL